MKKKLIASIIFFILIFSFAYRYVTTPRIKVFGTEYSPQDSGRVFIQLLSDAFTPVTDAQCFVTIYKPDSSFFVQEQIMNYVDNGLYKYDFIAPNVTGVYMVSVSCSYPNNLTVYYPTNFSYYSNGWYDLQTYYIYYEDGVLSPAHNNFKISFDQVNETPLLIVFRNAFQYIDKIDIYLYNHETSTWDLKIVEDYYTPEISLLVNDTKYIPVRIGMESENGKNFEIEMCNIQVYCPASQYQNNVRGGGEVHVALKKTIISDIEIPQVKIIG